VLGLYLLKRSRKVKEAHDPFSEKAFPESSTLDVRMLHMLLCME
jgi:hypothetical protein